MNTAQESLQGHISDMKGALDHLNEAFRRQAEDPEVHKDVVVTNLVKRLVQVSESQSQALKRPLERLGGEPKDALKHALAAMTGALAGLYDKLRPNPVSRMLRDDYTALSLAVVSHSMLLTTAEAAGDEETAALSRQHIRELTPLIIQLGEVVLPVVERELSAEFSPRAGAAEQALKAVRAAWSQEPAGKRS